MTPPLKHLVYARCKSQRSLISRLKLFNHPTYERIDFIFSARIFLGQNVLKPMCQLDLLPVGTIPPAPLPSIVINLKLGSGGIESGIRRKMQDRPQTRFISVGSEVVNQRIKAVKEYPIKRGLHSLHGKIQEEPLSTHLSWMIGFPSNFPIT